MKPLLLFAAACLVSSVAQAPGQQPNQPPIRSGVELVLVDVQVVDRQGRPIGSLRPEDFEVSLDGKRRRVLFATALVTLASGMRLGL